MLYERVDLVVAAHDVDEAAAASPPVDASDEAGEAAERLLMLLSLPEEDVHVHECFGAVAECYSARLSKHASAGGESSGLDSADLFPVAARRAIGAFLARPLVRAQLHGGQVLEAHRALLELLQAFPEPEQARPATEAAPAATSAVPDGDDAAHALFGDAADENGEEGGDEEDEDLWKAAPASTDALRALDELAGAAGAGRPSWALPSHSARVTSPVALASPMLQPDELGWAVASVSLPAPIAAAGEPIGTPHGDQLLAALSDPDPRMPSANMHQLQLPSSSDEEDGSAAGHGQPGGTGSKSASSRGDELALPPWLER